MGKTNYTKVEESLAEGLRKMSVNELIEAAPTKNAPGVSSRENARRGLIIKALQVDLRYLSKAGHDLYQKLQIDKDEIKKFSENPAAITKEEWEKVKSLKEKVDLFKKGLEEKQKAEEINENLVKTERRKHVNKRFNVNDKWLPLK